MKKQTIDIESLPDDIKNIVTALAKKSKKTLANKEDELIKQALYFAPEYREFIYKVIRNNLLKIVHKNGLGYTLGELDEDFWNGAYRLSLTKRGKNKIVCDISRPYCLPHELGHAVDFWSGQDCSLSKTIVIEDNKSLYDIFTEEFESNYQQIYELIMEEYKNLVNSALGDGSYDILISNMNKYRELQSIPIIRVDKEIMRKRKKIQEELYDCGFVETYYRFNDKYCVDILNTRYSAVLDMLSSKYDLSGLDLDSHTLNYYKERTKYGPTYELFADLFFAKVTNQYRQLNGLKKLLPKSVAAFEKIFNIFFAYIQSNKRYINAQMKHSWDFYG